MFALNDGSSSQPHPAGRATVWGPKTLPQVRHNVGQSGSEGNRGHCHMMQSTTVFQGEISETVSELEEEEVSFTEQDYCTALHCTALQCTALHCTALHCTALHCYLSG